MLTTTTRRFEFRIAAAALAFVSTANVAAENTDITVYRCSQASGAVSYQDYPCKGGAIVDIRPGAPAPDATQRLERARDELDRAAARRQANDEIAAVRRAELNQRRQEMETAQRFIESATSPPDFTYGPGYGFYAPSVKDRPHRPNLHRRAEHGRVIPEGRVPAVIHRPHPG